MINFNNLSTEETILYLYFIKPLHIAICAGKPPSSSTISGPALSMTILPMPGQLEYETMVLPWFLPEAAYNGDHKALVVQLDTLKLYTEGKEGKPDPAQFYKAAYFVKYNFLKMKPDRFLLERWMRDEVDIGGNPL